LGPGDTLEVQIAGRLDIDRFQVVVDPTGAISVPPLGSIQVGGLGLLEAHRRVVQRASTVFRFADVTLSVSAPRTLEVTLSGEVERPGTLTVSALRRLHEVILDAGGVTPRGGVRRVHVSRRSGDTEVDLLRFELRGDLSQNPFVEVRGAFGGTPESSKTTVAGKTTIVQRFELAQGDRVRDFVFRAGGAAAYADLRQAVVERGGATGPRQRIPIDLERLIVEKDETPNILLQNGDVLTLPVVEDKVYVVGEVKNPGGVEFRPEFTPREYVTLVGGPTPRAKLKGLFVTFRNGKSYAMADAPPLEPGAVVTVPEVSWKWWQDYLAIAQAVETEANTKPALLHALNDIFYQNYQAGRDSVVIVDEAQLIEDDGVFEELRLLLNFQTDDRFLVTLLLVGSPELAVKVRRMKHLDQRITLRYHLNTLDYSHTANYVAYRLKMAGQLKPLFTEAAIKLIFDFTRGT